MPVAPSDMIKLVNATVSGEFNPFNCHDCYPPSNALDGNALTYASSVGGDN